MGKTVYWYQDEKKIELIENAKDEPLVTDADVIVDTADKKDKVKEEKPQRDEKLDSEAKVTIDEAKKAVLDKAELLEKDVVFTKAKLEEDDGRLVYEVDFKTDTDRYDAEVDALTGKITEWEVEAKKPAEKKDAVVEEKLITIEKDKKLALDKAGLKEKYVVF